MRRVRLTRRPIFTGLIAAVVVVVVSGCSES
jgi:hypothetical protein